MVFVKAADDIQSNFHFIVRNGLAQLMQGMKKARRFDPDNPFPNYSEKNEYFDDANNICQVSLWHYGAYDLCERYYAILLQEIVKYEKANNTIFNKGMVYANLGVSQAAQGKIDEGFANILKAHMEDEPYHRTDASKSVFKLQLYTQFENQIISYIVQHSTLYQTEESTTVNNSFIENLISSLDTDSRLLFATQVEKTRRSFEILKDKDNRFTRLQIFLSLQDLCLSIENSLKVRNNLTGTMKPSLDFLFSTTSGRPRTWKPAFDDNYNFTRANSISEFQTNLTSILSLGDSKARRLLICCAVRNFSAHNLDVGNDYVFRRIELIFDNILASTLYLRHTGCI